MSPRIVSACLALTLSCASGFVSPAPRVSFPRTPARASSGSRSAAVDFLPFGGGEEAASAVAAAAAAATPTDASSSPLMLLQRATADAMLDVDLGVAINHPEGGGRELVSSAEASPLLLLASAAPGNASTASGLFGIAALLIALGAGFLVASTVTGKNGLGAFLSQEKGKNPFYQDTMAKYTPKTPDFLNKIRLPDLDFVDVYNQPPATDDYVDLEDDTTFDPAAAGEPDPNAIATAESLRQKLLMAVQAKDYELASTLERELANFLRKNGMGFEGDP